MTEITYTTGTVNKASMDKYELEGQRLLLFGVNSDDTDTDTQDTFIQINFVAEKQLWLCCWYVSGRKADISILNNEECKSRVQDVLRKWNWEENRQYWKMINGETIVCDVWNIGYDGEEMVNDDCDETTDDDDDGEEMVNDDEYCGNKYCGYCGNNKEPTNECFDCDIDYDIDCDRVICAKCQIKFHPETDCFKFDLDTCSYYCSVCAVWETKEPFSLDERADEPVIQRKKIIRKKTPPLYDV